MPLNIFCFYFEQLTYKTEGCRKINQEGELREDRDYWNFTQVKLSQTCVMTQCKITIQLRGITHFFDVRVYSTISNLILRSLSCFSSTLEGALLRGQTAFWVFGNAMTSLIDDAPASIITKRSSPRAMPP